MSADIYGALPLCRYATVLRALWCVAPSIRWRCCIEHRLNFARSLGDCSAIYRTSTTLERESSRELFLAARDSATKRPNERIAKPVSGEKNFEIVVPFSSDYSVHVRKTVPEIIWKTYLRLLSAVFIPMLFFVSLSTLM